MRGYGDALQQFHIGAGIYGAAGVGRFDGGQGHGRGFGGELLFQRCQYGGNIFRIQGLLQHGKQQLAGAAVDAAPAASADGLGLQHDALFVYRLYLQQLPGPGSFRLGQKGGNIAVAFRGAGKAGAGCYLQHHGGHGEPAAAVNQGDRQSRLAGIGQHLGRQDHPQLVSLCLPGGAAVGQCVVNAAGAVAFAEMDQRCRIRRDGPGTAVFFQPQPQHLAAAVILGDLDSLGQAGVCQIQVQCVVDFHKIPPCFKWVSS